MVEFTRLEKHLIWFILQNILIEYFVILESWNLIMTVVAECSAWMMLSEATHLIRMRNTHYIWSNGLLLLLTLHTVFHSKPRIHLHLLLVQYVVHLITAYSCLLLHPRVSIMEIFNNLNGWHRHWFITVLVWGIVNTVRDDVVCGCNLAPSWVLDAAGRCIIIRHSIIRNNATWLLPLRISGVVEQVSNILVLL